MKETIFGGLEWNPPTTIEGFITEASNIERFLLARARYHQRLPDVSAVPPSPCDLAHSIPSFPELISEVIREELEKLLPTAERPDSISITEVVRDEVQRSFLPDAPVIAAAPEEPTLTCAAMVR